MLRLTGSSSFAAKAGTLKNAEGKEANLIDPEVVYNICNGVLDEGDFAEVKRFHQLGPHA